VNAGRPKVVFDCNVFVQALTSERGPAAECLRLFEAGRFTLCVSPATLRELRAVLRYPGVRDRSLELTDERIDAFVDRIAYRANVLRRVRHVFDYPRAHQDEPYIDLVVAVNADYLVSRDKDLLSLQTGHSQVCKRFRQLTRPLRVLTPVEFLAAVSAVDPESGA
jgi:putative PIN family toxin of toxin-antitoxin system